MSDISKEDALISGNRLLTANPDVNHRVAAYNAIQALVAEVERLQTALDTAIKGEQESEANLAHALHQLATARDDALEEVAIKVERTAYFTNDEIETMSEMRRCQERATISADRNVHRAAASIRAMKAKPHA